MPKRSSTRIAAIKSMQNGDQNSTDLHYNDDTPFHKETPTPTQTHEPGSLLFLQVRNSDTPLDKLFEAIRKLNMKVRLVPHDSKSYSNTYASLQGIMGTISEALTANGLVILQFPCSYGNSIGVTTRIAHVSGQWIESSFLMPLPALKGANDTQRAGAAISYARRYALSASLGLVADKDIDAAWGEDS